MSLDEHSPELLAALEDATGLQVQLLHTGGGVHCLQIDLTQDGRFQGPHILLTRDANWIIGLYDGTEEDYGITLEPHLLHGSADDPNEVADTVAEMLERLNFSLFD